jgi:hypothetical protein
MAEVKSQIAEAKTLNHGGLVSRRGIGPSLGKVRLAQDDRSRIEEVRSQIADYRPLLLRSSVIERNAPIQDPPAANKT